MVALLAAGAATAVAATPPPAAEAQAELPPATPSWVTLKRADGTLTAEWPAAAGAASYHITYSPDGGQDWYLAAFEHTSTTITIHGVSTTPPT